MSASGDLRQFPKNRYGINDEWGAVVKAQGELISQMEHQERQQKEEMRLAYIQELEAQKKLQEMERDQMRKLKELETQQVRTKAQLFQVESQMKNQENFNFKKGIANENLSFKQNKLSNDLTTQQQKLQQEQLMLEAIRKQMQQDQERKQQEKQNYIQDVGQFMNVRQQQHEERKNLVMQGKQVEAQQAVEQQNRILQKEKEYRQYYDGLMKGIDNKQQLYSTQVAREHQVKEMEKAEWIAKNQKEHQQRLAEKEAYERYVRQQNQQEINSTVMSQVEFVNMMRAQQREEKLREEQEMIQKIQQNQVYNQMQMEQRKNVQNDYQKMLQYQMQIQKGTKLNQDRMTETEKKLNNQFLEAYQNKTPAQVKIPGLHSDYSSTVLRRSAQNILQKPASQYPASACQSPKNGLSLDQKFIEQNLPKSNINQTYESLSRQNMQNKNFNENTAAFYGADGNDYTQNAKRFYGVESSRGSMPNTLQSPLGNQRTGTYENKVSSSRNLVQRPF